MDLILTNFRSFKDACFEVSPQTIIIGSNSAGKTNILESVFFLATTSGFRGRRDSEMIKAGETFLRVEYIEIAGAIAKNYQAKKTFWLGGKKTAITAIPGHLPVVLFSPELLHAIGGAPQERRRMLNVYLAQKDSLYSALLSEYAAIVRQRNALLFLIKDGRESESSLDFWDKELVRVGTEIVLKRRQFLQKTNEVLSQKERLVWSKDLSLEYNSPIVDAQSFIQILLENRGREIKLSQTIIGPHRDDVIFRLDGNLLAQFGSRGEWRISLIMYLFATSEIFEIERPVIFLLDDVFSELDESRRVLLQESLKDKQFIITSTDAEEIDPKLLPNTKTILLNGRY